MNARHEPVVYVVDDDPAVRDSLTWLLESVGIRVIGFERPTDFLQAYPAGQPGCILLDVRMPGLSGLHIQKMLPAQGIDLPVIFLTGHGDVPMAVNALKAGAFDFIEKPFNDQHLLDRVQQALEKDREWRVMEARRQEIRSRLDTLTPRERAVVEPLVRGMSNKEIASALGVSHKTVEVHRAKVMQKMRADTLSDLIRMALFVGLIESRPDTAM